MPKKPPRNAYYYFMLDFKEEQERNGVKFPNGMRDVAEAAKEEWPHLDPNIRETYERRAKEEKSRAGIPENKFTSQGVSYAEIDRQESEKKRLEEQEINDVNNIIQKALLSNNIEEQVFHVIDVDVYCTTSHYEEVPLEIALAEFNLHEGVKEIFHTFVNTEIPTGYFSEAKQACTRHGISGPPIDNGEDDLLKILSSLIDLTESDPFAQYTKYPLFTMPASISKVKGVLKYLCDITNVSPDTFKVYSLCRLFFLLKNAVAKHPSLAFPADTLAYSELTKDVFAYSRGLACMVDEENDTSLQCTKSQVQRWCFTICDHCCQLIGIQLEPGKHVPASTDIHGASKSSRSVSRLTNVPPSLSGVSEKPRPSSKMSNYTDVSISAASSSVGAWSTQKETLAKRMSGLRIEEKSFSRATSSTSAAREVPKADEVEFRRPYTSNIVADSKNFKKSDFPQLGVSRGRGFVSAPPKK